jgi:hypothetical protein
LTFSRIKIECNRKHYQWWGDGDPLRFVVLKRKPESKIGRIEKVRVEDVTARGQGDGLIVRDAAQVSLGDVEIRWDAARGIEPKWRSGLRAERVDDLRLEEVRIDAAPGSEAPAVTGAAAAGKGTGGDGGGRP